jgi:putative DNA-invertase from lambdoid prophage Rac
VDEIRGTTQARVKRAAVYLRVSTPEQELRNQLPSILASCRARGCELVTVRVEVESRDKSRPALAQLLEEAHRATFDTLVIWAIDRLGAGTLEMLTTVSKLDACGVATVSVTESWLEQQGPMRELLLSIFGWVSKQELRKIRERTKAGLARARAEGKRLGRPRLAYARAQLEQLVAEDASIDAIAAALGCHRATAARLKRRCLSSRKNGVEKKAG